MRMAPDHIMGFFLRTVLTVLTLSLSGWNGWAEELKVNIVDKKTKEAMPVRCKVMDSQGVAIKPVGKGFTLMEGVDHFYTEGPFTLNLETGLKYQLQVDRGMMWIPADVVFSVTASGKTANLQMTSIFSQKQGKWISGDMDLRVPVSQMPVILGSADLNVACQTLPAADVTQPERKRERGVTHHPASRAYSGCDWNFGDFNLISASSLMSIGETPFNASQLPLLEKGRNLMGMVDVVNPEGEEVPVAAALDWVDTMRVVGPRNNADEVWTEAQVIERFKAYYQYLDCGFHIPISAASLAAEKTLSPLDRAGSARVLARLSKINDFSFRAFTDLIKAGRSWATNGPLLTLTVNGQDPIGRDLLAKGELKSILYSGKPLKVVFGARSVRPLSRVELLYNGEVVASPPVSATSEYAAQDFDLTASEGGWVVARAFEAQTDPNAPVRYAHSSPVYVLSSGHQKINKSQAQTFLSQIEQRLGQLRTEFPSPDATGAKVLGWYEQARQKYLKLLE